MSQEELKLLLTKIKELNDDDTSLKVLQLAAESMAFEQLKTLRGNDEPSKDIKAEISSEEDNMLINISGISVNAKPRADGRYQGYLTADDGKRKYFYGGSSREVEEKIKFYRKQNAVSGIRRKKQNSPTFNEFADEWYKTYKEPNLKIKSLTTIKSVLSHARQNFGDKKMNNISTDDVQKMLISMPQGRTRDLCKQYVNQIFEKAKAKRVIRENPCDGVEIKKHVKQHKPALTRAEQTEFLAHLDKVESRYALLFRFLLSTGLRIGEALALTKKDIDFEKCTVNVCKDVVFDKNKRIVQTPKSATSYRTVPVPQAICEELKHIKTDDIFPFSYNAVNKAIQRLRANLGFNVTIHTLRHTYATRLEEANVSPKVKQALMGHSSLEMTQNVYTDTQTEYLESMSDSIRNVFNAV